MENKLRLLFHKSFFRPNRHYITMFLSDQKERKTLFTRFSVESHLEDTFYFIFYDILKENTFNSFCQNCFTQVFLIYVVFRMTRPRKESKRTTTTSNLLWILKCFVFVSNCYSLLIKSSYIFLILGSHTNMFPNSCFMFVMKVSKFTLRCC